MQAWGRLVSLNGRWSDVELSRNKMKFGRNSACQVKYDDMRISNLHFSIEKSSETDEKAVVWDYSTNGLFVNGNLIGRGNKQMIVDGDMLSLIVVPVRRSDGTYHHSDSSLNFIAYKFHFVSDEDETVDIAEVEEQPVAKVRYRGVRCDEEEELVKEGGEKKTMNHEGMKQNSQSLNEEVPALASNNIVHTQPNEQTSSSNNHFHSGMKEEKRMETTSSSSRTEQQVAVKVENQTKDEVEDENPPSAKRQCISPSDASNPRKSLDWSQNEENAGSLQEFEARYEKTNEIGEGAYAKVYVAVRKDTEQKVAVKILHLAKLKINGIRDSQVQDEINIQMKLSHPNIVRMLEYYFDAATKRFLLVMEHVAGGDLFEYLISKPDECISEELARKWFKQLLDGVEYCHSMEVVHRDLKPENILLTDNSADCILKISDFGLAKALAKGRECRTNCGTPKYMAPEVFAVGRGLKKYGKEADLWGLGVILYVMLTCSMPFGGEDDEDLEEEMIQIAHGKKMYADLFNCDAWETKSKEVKNMISQLLEPDMQKRLTVEAARKHRWMREEEKG